MVVWGSGVGKLGEGEGWVSSSVAGNLGGGVGNGIVFGGILWVWEVVVGELTVRRSPFFVVRVVKQTWFAT